MNISTLADRPVADYALDDALDALAATDVLAAYAAAKRLTGPQASYALHLWQSAENRTLGGLIAAASTAQGSDAAEAVALHFRVAFPVAASVLRV